MTDLSRLTLKEALAGIQSGAFSAVELQQSVLSSIEEQDDELHAYLARQSEVSGETSSGPLAGIPIAVKDNFLTQDLVTTASSKVLDGYVPQYESTVTKRLRAAGAYIVGKTNLDAWAHGSSTETSDYGPTKNPRNPHHMPGGSSGGSAAAVAADMCTLAIGSETAGSIRQPSAWCGVVGLKPTYGRVSRYGVVAMASSLDCPGPIAKTVEDAAFLLPIIAGQDPHDGTTSPTPVEEYVQYLEKPITGLKIGAIYFDVDGLDPRVKAQYEAELKVFERLGATVEYVSALDPHYAIGAYAVLQRGEVSSNLARFDGIRYGHDRSVFGAEAKRRIMIGTYTLSAGYAEKYYLKAQQVRTLYIRNFAELFKKYDVLVAPSAPGFALPLGESEKYPYFGELMDMYLEPSSIAGLPGISVPCYVDPETKLPLGLNIMAPFFGEGRILQVAQAYERATDWNPWVKAMREGGRV